MPAEDNVWPPAAFCAALAHMTSRNPHGCRYVQLPINAAMPEAWEQSFQTVEIDGAVQKLTFMQAAARLGVGVFASASLREGALLQDTALEVRCRACLQSLGPLIALGPSGHACILKMRCIGKEYILAGMSLQARLDGMEEFNGIFGSGTRMLQISRSTPYLSSALVGHKRVSASPSSAS